MDGRIVLEGMNREIIGAIKRGAAPWRKPVTEGEVDFRAADMYANSEMSGLAGWYLEAVADRRGWDGSQWWTAFDTAQDCRRMKPEAEPVRALETEPVGRKVVTRVDRWFCAAQFMPDEVQGTEVIGDHRPGDHRGCE